MSKASWYRHGKPTTKPEKPLTAKQEAAQFGISVRTLYRFRQLNRYPEVFDFIIRGELTCKRALRLIKEHDEEEKAIIYLPDLSASSPSD
jgi:hypothetical protein